MDGGYGATVVLGMAVLCYAMLCYAIWRTFVSWGAGLGELGELGSWGVVVGNGWLIQHNGCVDGWWDGGILKAAFERVGGAGWRMCLPLYSILNS